MATVAGGCADAPSPQARVVGPDGAPRLAVRVELAVTPAERVRGLRGHAPLGPRDGLLIVTPGPSELCIVNDGVSFAIDEVFARADGVVAAVEREVAAGDPTPHCHEGIQSVLEVAAGVAARVRPGDRLIAPAP
ncbi:MAG: DUF192 domain-containing protein [Myxococcales bacterium]|nr:DUF192 domain-containing protein [Myxococcales bacterium]